MREYFVRVCSVVSDVKDYGKTASGLYKTALIRAETSEAEMLLNKFLLGENPAVEVHGSMGHGPGTWLKFSSNEAESSLHKIKGWELRGLGGNEAEARVFEKWFVRLDEQSMTGAVIVAGIGGTRGFEIVANMIG